MARELKQAIDVTSPNLADINSNVTYLRTLSLNSQLLATVIKDNIDNK